MAPAEDSAFFPPLQRCLDGSSKLLSWKSVALELASGVSRPIDQTVIQHLQDPAALRVLLRCIDAPSVATPQSKSELDTLTAAINVTPTTNGRYNISELKEDALWLSKETEIDEVSALRLSLLQWQSRPAERLLQDGAPYEPHNQGLNRPDDSLKASFLLSTTSRSNLNYGRTTLDFDSQRTRQLELLKLYASESQYLLQTTEYLVAQGVSALVPTDSIHTLDPLSADRTVEEIGIRVLDSWKLRTGWSSKGKTWFDLAISYLERKLRVLRRDSGWSFIDGSNSDLEQQWSRTNVIETLSLLQIMLVIGSLSTVLAPSSFILDWFRFMDRAGYFQSLDITAADLCLDYIPNLNALVALNSLGFIQLHQACAAFPSLLPLGNPTQSELAGSPSYLNDGHCINDITDLLANAATAETASLAVLAWCVVLQMVRDLAGASTEKQEIRQNERTIQSYNATPQPNSNATDGEVNNGVVRRRLSPNRRSSFGSDLSQQPTVFEDVVEHLRVLEPNENIVLKLAGCAVEQCFDLTRMLAQDFCLQPGSVSARASRSVIRMLLLDLVSFAIDDVGYQESTLESIFAILLGDDDFWTIHDGHLLLKGSFDSGARFMRDDLHLSRVLNLAVNRFPFEPIPFVKLCRGLVPFQTTNKRHDQFFQFLSHIPTLTTQVAEPRILYDLDDNGDTTSLMLAAPVNILAMAFPFLEDLPRVPVASETLELPLGTIGRALTEGKPIVALWNYPYSALQFFGLVLQTTLELRAESQIPAAHPLFELSTEIVAFLSTWIESLTSDNQPRQDGTIFQDLARNILEDASDCVGRNGDVIAVMLDLLEGELFKQHSSTQESDSKDFITRGMQFLTVVAAVMPSRIWPFLGRSGLLGLNGTESRLTAVIVATELPSGRFPILISSIRLFEALVEDAVASAVLKKARSKSLKHYGSIEFGPSGTSIPESTRQKILLQSTKVLMDIFQSSNTWKFWQMREKLVINYRICNLFARIVSICFEADNSNDLDNKIVSSLAPCASYLVDTFLSSGQGDPTLKPLLQILTDGLRSPLDMPSSRISELWQGQTVSAVSLSTKFLRLNRFLGRETCEMSRQVFGGTISLAKLYVVHPSYRVPVIELFEAAVVDVGSSQQPPSLLGPFSESAAASFLDCLANFSMHSENKTLSIATWRFFTAVVSHRQQWLAVYLLTGRTAKNTLTAKDRDNSSSTSKSLIQIALAKLSHLPELEPAEAVAMLEFIALAADYWQPVALQVRNDQTCKEACLNYVENLRTPDVIKHSQSQADICQYQIAAYIVNILALIVHHSNERRDTTTLRHIIPRLGYLIKHSVSSPSYNASMHHGLKRNLESLFEGCEPSNFKRTSINRASLGPLYYYDLSLAQNVLNHDAAWLGKSNRGFANEFARANLNLSIVSGQFSLFHSWKSLATQLSEGLAADRGFQKSMASIIQACLVANLENTLPETIFGRLATSRADLAFILLQSLIQTAPNGDDVQGIIDSAWPLVQQQGTDVASLLIGDESAYYRTLLRILYLSLQPHTSAERLRRARTTDNVEKERSDAKAKRAKKVEVITLELLGIIVARGFRSMIIALHEDPSRVLPSDFALLIAILRTALQVPGVSSYSERLLSYFEDEKTVQYASTLLSWSDQLATERDPVYGELSISFLVELSNLPVLAESLVVSGTFAQIALTNTLKPLRILEGVGPFDEPRRLFDVWSRGLLPLVINIIASVGPPIAAELSEFLRQFQAQLVRASQSFGVKLSPVPADAYAGYVTLSVAAEAHALALITQILQDFRESGPSLGIVASDVVQLQWDSAGVREDLETRLQRRNNLRNSIVPMDEQEEMWSRQKPLNKRGTCENRLEEKVVSEMIATLSLLKSGS